MTATQMKDFTFNLKPLLPKAAKNARPSIVNHAAMMNAVHAYQGLHTSLLTITVVWPVT